MAAIAHSPKHFEVFRESDYVMVRLTGVLDNESAKDFLASFKAICEPMADVIFNAEQLSDLSVSWMRAVLQLQKQLNARNKNLRFIHLSTGVLKLLKQEGLDSSLKSSASLRGAMVDLGIAKSEKVLDVNFINPFLSATIDVLQKQASTLATPGKIYRRQANEKFMGDISGVIGLISEAFSGSVVISFPANTFLKIMTRMLGEECTEITKDIEDGAGELTNIIFGQAKIGLNERGFGIKTALPSVISGNDHSILQMTQGPRMVIPFDSDAGAFVVEICLSN